MNPNEKAVETRRRHKEAQDQKYREELQIRESMKRALHEVLDSEGATVSEKLEASKILSKLIA